jgi:hypothetical protein
MPHPHCILPPAPNTSPLAPAADRPILVSICQHRFLVVPAGVLIVAAVLTIPGLIQLFTKMNKENKPAVFRIAFQVIGGTIIASALAYIGAVIGTFASGHPTW